MATAGAVTGVAEHTSSYRVKFKRKEFLGLVEVVNPNIIYIGEECISLLMTSRNVHVRMQRQRLQTEGSERYRVPKPKLERVVNPPFLTFYFQV